MNTMTSPPEATAMPVFTPANPARTTPEQLAAIDAGAYVNEFYELVYPGEYEESQDYTFEITSDGVVRDRFSFFGPYSAGMELAGQRAARFDSPFIHVEI